MTLQEDDKPKSTLQGVAIALLYYSLLRETEVAMITVESITTFGSQHQIEVMFLHNHKRRNEGSKFFIPSKFYPMFSRYIGEICQNWVATGHHQFSKNWNKFAKDPEYWQEQHQHAPGCCLQDPEKVQEWLFQSLLATKCSHKPSQCWGVAY